MRPQMLSREDFARRCTKCWVSDCTHLTRTCKWPDRVHALHKGPHVQCMHGCQYRQHPGAAQDCPKLVSAAQSQVQPRKGLKRSKWYQACFISCMQPGSMWARRLLVRWQLHVHAGVLPRETLRHARYRVCGSVCTLTRLFGTSVILPYREIMLQASSFHHSIVACLVDGLPKSDVSPDCVIDNPGALRHISNAAAGPDCASCLFHIAQHSRHLYSQQDSHKSHILDTHSR